jgi:hypothetical protein
VYPSAKIYHWRKTIPEFQRGYFRAVEFRRFDHIDEMLDVARNGSIDPKLAAQRIAVLRWLIAHDGPNRRSLLRGAGRCCTLAVLRTTAFIAPSNSVVETPANSAWGQSAAPQRPQARGSRGRRPARTAAWPTASTRPRRRSARRGSALFRREKQTRYAQLEPFRS